VLVTARAEGTASRRQASVPNNYVQRIGPHHSDGSETHDSPVDNFLRALRRGPGIGGYIDGFYNVPSRERGRSTSDNF